MVRNVYNFLIGKLEEKAAVINIAVDARIILKRIVMAEGRLQSWTLMNAVQNIMLYKGNKLLW